MHPDFFQFQILNYFISTMDKKANNKKAIAAGTITTPGDSHRSWLAEKEGDGWVYGPVKDPERKEHPCMVPFGQLPKDQQAKDFLFLATVKAALWPDGAP